MPSSWQGEERRSHPRIAIAGTVEGALDSVVEAPIVDLSLAGALVEVPQALPSGGRCRLRIPTSSGDTLDLSGQVVRSYVHGFHKDRSGQPSVRYRAAIKFVDLSESQNDKMKTFLEADARAPSTAGKPN